MSLQIRSFSVLAYAQGFTYWHYKTPIGDDILTPGYFNDIKDMVVPGDLIIATNQDNAQSVFIKQLRPTVIVGVLAKSE
jgi:hypothetical protein